MPNWDKDLTPPHLNIARSASKKIGVLAGPGTGKTSYGLMRRVTRLLEEGESGKGILLISFTRTAATDLKSKIENIGIPEADNIKATTLHAYCYGLLQSDAVLLITGRTPRTLLEHERDLMLRDLVGNFGDIHSRRRRLKAYEAGWARNTEDYPGAPSNEEDKSFQTQVLAWMRHHKAMLIGEVVPLAYHYLASNPGVDARRAFRHIIVDEYQDLNTVEQKVIELLADEESSNVCVAGDDDQSIYSFRYANPRGILDFVGRGDVEKYEITKSGRSPEPILIMANALIANAPGRSKAPLTCGQTTPGSVATIQWPDLQTEIDGIVAAIAHDVRSERRQAGDVLVLTPRQYIGERIRDALREQGVDAHSYFAEESLKTEKAQGALAILSLLVDADDKVAWRVLLGLGDSTGRADAYLRLRKYAEDNKKSEVQVLEELQKGIPGLPLRALASRFQETKTQLEALKDLPVADVAERLMPEGDVEVVELRVLALEALEQADSVEELRRALTSSITQPEVPQSPTSVRIMSLHKSKGLTAPSVYLVGAVDGLIPFIKGADAEGERQAKYDEQRRLLYVAITRSSDQLVISSSLTMGKEAYGMGIADKVRVQRRLAGGGLIVRTFAMPFLAEFGNTQPKPVRGEDWLAQYTGGST